LFHNLEVVVITSNNSRSLQFSFANNTFAKTFSALVLALVLSSGSVFAQANISEKSTNEATESFVSAAELVQNEVNFTPARVDVAAIKKSVQYPESALKNNVTGRFDLIIYVNNTGDVNTVNFVTDRPENNSMNAIIAAACDAVKKSHFTPATLNNKAISSTVRIPFSFIM
jgi:TonB family protein